MPLPEGRRRSTLSRATEAINRRTSIRRRGRSSVDRGAEQPDTRRTVEDVRAERRENTDDVERQFANSEKGWVKPPDLKERPSTKADVVDQVGDRIEDLESALTSLNRRTAEGKPAKNDAKLKKIYEDTLGALRRVNNRLKGLNDEQAVAIFDKVDDFVRRKTDEAYELVRGEDAINTDEGWGKIQDSVETTDRAGEAARKARQAEVDATNEDIAANYPDTSKIDPWDEQTYH
jgi:predicted  nucleic acid-binding Zn-ribbon protein